jgi:enediyne biosynthesis protein CalE5
VLDVAAGYGEPSLTAARVAGPEGSVVATDISAGMLAFGRERAAAAGVDNIEFIEADASSLDFPAESFDAALSRRGIIFDPDGEGSAARIRGFLRPGAKMAIASWGPPERCEGGGFSDVQVEELDVEFEWASPEDFTRLVKEIAAPITAMISQHPPEVQEETWGAITEASRAHEDADGKVTLTNLALLAVGTA